jgi:hypothetical protein
MIILGKEGLDSMAFLQDAKPSFGVHCEADLAISEAHALCEGSRTAAHRACVVTTNCLLVAALCLAGVIVLAGAVQAAGGCAAADAAR